MKCKKLCCLFLMLLTSGVASASGPQEGAPAPHALAVTLDGRTIDTEALRGKVVMLHFWATWCPPCREEMPALEKFYAEQRDSGLEIIAVSTDEDSDEAKVREFARRYSYPVALLSASKVERFGRIWALPLTFVIDRKGVLRKTDWTGEEKINAASLGRIVQPLLHEK